MVLHIWYSENVRHKLILIMHQIITLRDKGNTVMPSSPSELTQLDKLLSVYSYLHCKYK